MSRVSVLLKKFFPEKREVNGAHIYTVQQVVESENKKKLKVERLLSLSEEGIKILQSDETPEKSFVYGQIIKFKTEPKQNIWGFTASENKKSVEYLFYTKQVWDIRDSNANFVELNLKKKGREGEFRKKMEAQNADQTKLPYKFSQTKSTDSNSNTNTNTNISDEDSASFEMEDLSEHSEKRNSPKKKMNTGNEEDSNKVEKKEEKTPAEQQVNPQSEKISDNKEQDEVEDPTKKEVKKEKTKRKSKKAEDINDESQQMNEQEVVEK